jgi:hypothetical protein
MLKSDYDVALAVDHSIVFHASRLVNIIHDRKLYVFILKAANSKNVANNTRVCGGGGTGGGRH